MAKTFDSVVIYKSWLDAARKYLPEEEVNRLMVQLMEYGFDGTMPKNDNASMDIIFDMAKPLIDSNIEKRINGSKGGRGKKKSAKTSGLSNVNVNANDNVNVNVNGNDNDNVLPSDGTAAIESAAGSSSEDNDDEWWRTDDAAV